jgi:hypothetical protein
LPVRAKRKRVAAAIAPAKPERHHLDKRAHAILAAAADADDEDQMTTAETAAWLGVSKQWLEKARQCGYGPPFTQISKQIIRYSRAMCRAWLLTRTRRSTAEYREP